MPDISVTRVFTAGKGQYLALIKRYPDQLYINISRAKKANIRFGDGIPIKLLKTATVNTPFGLMDFHVIKSDTFFLMLLKNMDRLEVYLNNTIN